MWPLPVSALFTCGHSSAETLHKLGILTIGDLAKTDPAILEAHLKSHGRCLWQYANGIDDSTVVLAPSKAKGIGNSTTLSSDATTKEEACKVLLSLCESVGRRLRASHQLAGQICTEIRYSDFRNVSHQMPIDIPTASVNLLYEDACALFDELWDSTLPSWCRKTNRFSSACLIFRLPVPRNSRSWMPHWIISGQNMARMPSSGGVFSNAAW